MTSAKINKLKVAIVHDVFIMKGGAERSVDELLKIFPSADIYTSFFNDDERFSHIKKRLKKSLKKNFLIDQYTVQAKIFIQSYWESLDLNGYDVVISSSDEFSSKSVITSPDTLHICYCYTPPRYLYPEYPNINTIKSLFPAKRKLMLSYLRIQDYVAGHRPDLLVAISKTIQERIKKYYRRESVVIYPPVSIPSDSPTRKNASDYYLYVGALVQRKGLDLAVDVFNRNHKKLVIIGDGRDRERLQASANKNITFTGFISDADKDRYLSSARGFIFPSLDEDFGIAPIEAMSFGVPVIAYYSGGLRETVIDGKTGVFFRQHTVESFNAAIRRYEKMKFNKQVLYKQAKKYSDIRFRKEFLNLVLKEYAKKQAG